MFMAIVILLVSMLLGIKSQDLSSDLPNKNILRYPCDANRNIYFAEYGESDDGELLFILTLKQRMKKNTFITAKFTTPTVFNTSDTSMEFYFSRLDTLHIYLLKKEDKVLIRLKTVNGILPEIESLVINNVERCKKNPLIIETVNLMELFTGDKESKPSVLPRDINVNCGERKIHHTRLITHGSATKLGDWPWHVALHRQQKNIVKYICGGTLISKTVVLTAAHCVTINGIKVSPKTLSVSLGKYALFGGEETPQERKVFQIIVHQNFNYSNLDHDIALLTLQSEAAYNDYVQPACLWTPDLFEDIPIEKTIGTVVGWGLDHTDSTALELQQATFPRIDELKCIKSEPLFFSSALNEQSFCAGWTNGTSACQGDSGGGFHVFVPNILDDTSSTAPGRWYVQGIVSQSASDKETSGCDPTHYVIFTDVSKLLEWIGRMVN